MESDPNFSGTVACTQGSTYYETYGDGDGEWVVFLHGITFYSFCFRGVVQPIVAKGYRVLLFDFFGRGQSDAPPIVYNLDLYVSQTKQLLEHLNITRANLIGFSMGGCVAGAFSARQPDFVNKLIFVAPAVVPVDIPFVARLLTIPYIGRGIYNLLGKQAMLQKLRTERLRDDFAFPEKVPQVIDDAIKKVEWLIEEKVGFLHAFHSTLYNMPLGTGILEELAKIPPAIRVYVMWGELDKVIPLEKSLFLFSVFPQAKFTTIKDCGHSCVLEKPVESTQTLVEFLLDTDPNPRSKL